VKNRGPRARKSELAFGCAGYFEQRRDRTAPQSGALFYRRAAPRLIQIIRVSPNKFGIFAVGRDVRRVSSSVSILAVGDWKQLKVGVGVGPTRVLHGSASAAIAGAARALAKHIARRASSGGFADCVIERVNAVNVPAANTLRS